MDADADDHDDNMEEDGTLVVVCRLITILMNVSGDDGTAWQTCIMR